MSEIRVRPGDLWEFNNEEGFRERHALMWIVKVHTQGKDPDKDTFTMLVLEDDDSPNVCYLQRSHLTIRTSKYGHLWRKIV